MATNYVLIDFENVQPQNLRLLADHPIRLYVFVGANQTKVPIEFARNMQDLGARAQYVSASGHGRNALDFHIAFYAGELSVADPEAYFHIVSRDTGYDPLIAHLRNSRARRVRIWRRNDLGEIPILGIPNSAATDEKIDKIVKNLTSRGQSRPRKVTTLANTINTLFTTPLDERELSELLKEMENRKYIAVSDDNISYKLPVLPSVTTA